MNLIALILSLILIIATSIYVYFKRQFSFFKRQGVAYVKPSFPFGNIQGIGSKYHMSEILINLYNQLKDQGPIAGFFNLAEPTYLLTDLDIVKDVLVKNFNSFVNRGMYYNEKDEPLTAHLVAVEDERWRFLRSKLSPALTSGKLKGMFHIISDIGKNLINTIEKKSKNGTAIELKDLMSKFTIDVVSSTTFGMDSNTLNDFHPELLDISKEVFGKNGPSGFYFFFLIAFPELARSLHLRLFSKNVSDFFINVVGSNIKNREDKNIERHDFLNMLVQLKNKGSIDGEFSKEIKKLTMNEVLAQAFVFFFAGSDTTSTTLSYAFTELARNVIVQEKIRQEIKEKTKDANGEITYENLHEMTYLSQVVNETLRMYTPGFANIRKAGADYKVPNTKITIKKGSTVFIPTLAIHYDEKYWPNPHKFDPERFTSEEIAKRPAYCYFPFGEGPRNCIGMRFALVNTKFAIATIIKNFKVIIDSRMEYPIKFDPSATSMESIQGYWVKFEKI